SLAAGVGFAYLLHLFGFVRLVNLIPFIRDTPYSPSKGGVWGGCLVFAVVFFGSGSPWLSYTIARLWLASRQRLPWRLIHFLEDAHRRGVLRQAGPIYQFRHIRLQTHLTESLNRRRATGRGRVIRA